jgi:hypothetical protein
VQLVAHPQQEIVGGLELAPFVLIDPVAGLELGQRARAIFHQRHPQQVLVIAQPAAAVLYVGFLHAGGVAKLRPPDSLIFQSRSEVVVLLPTDAALQERLLQTREELFVADHQPGLEQRRLGQHVLVGESHRFVDRAHRAVAGREAGVEHRANEVAGQGAIGLGQLIGEQSAAFQEHEIDVAKRAEFRPAITARGNQRDGHLFRWRPRWPEGAQNRLEYAVHHGRASPADLEPAGPILVKLAENLGLFLEKFAEPRQGLVERLLRRQRKTLHSLGFQLRKQRLHGPGR